MNNRDREEHVGDQCQYNHLALCGIYGDGERTSHIWRVRCDTHHTVTFWLLGGYHSTGQTSICGKVLCGYRILVMVFVFIGVLDIWRPLIRVEEYVKEVIPCRWGANIFECQYMSDIIHGE